jgi:hypothetical protein
MPKGFMQSIKNKEFGAELIKPPFQLHTFDFLTLLKHWETSQALG